MAAAAFLILKTKMIKATGRIWVFWFVWFCFFSLEQVGALDSGVNGVCASLPYEASSKHGQSPPALGGMSRDAASPSLNIGNVLDRLVLYPVCISSTVRAIWVRLRWVDLLQPRSRTTVWFKVALGF